MNRTDVYRDYRKSLGLALVFIGMQLNTAIKNIFIGADFSMWIMLSSAALLLVDPKNFTRIKMSLSMKILLGFQIVLLFFACESERGTSQLITFHLYLISVILSLSTNKDYLAFKSFPAIMFWMSGFIAIVILYQATNGFTHLVVSYEGTSKLWLEQGGDPITMSRALGMSFITCLFYENKGKLAKIVSPIFIIADIIGVFSFINRSVMLCSLVIFLIWYLFYYSRKLTPKKMLMVVLFLIVSYVLIPKIPYLTIKIDSMYQSMRNGIGTLLNDNNTKIDASANTRQIILTQTQEVFNKRFIRNLLLGLGYNYTYIDRPVYQIFFDFGIFGLFIYAYYLLYIPAKNILKQTQRNALRYNCATTIITYISLQMLFDQFLTGLPYYYFLWTPTIFILFSAENYKARVMVVESKQDADLLKQQM